MMRNSIRMLIGPSEEMTKEKVEKLLERGSLGGIIEAYEKNPEIRKHTIPRTGDTALHVAVSDGHEPFAERMIQCAENGVLALGNKQGDTALHLAAKFDNAYLCLLIAEKDVSLIGACNDYGETPLFSAVTNGSTGAFLYLHHFCINNGCLEYGRHISKDGDTILHSAISGQYFELAYSIIREYPDLVHEVNKEGLSPLHLLATRPSVFPSGLHLSAIQKLIYRCVRVQKLEEIWKHSEAPSPKRKDNYLKMMIQHIKNKFGLETTQDEANNTQVGQSENQQDEEAANEQDLEGDKITLHHFSSPSHRGSVARCISYSWRCLRKILLALLMAVSFALLLPILVVVFYAVPLRTNLGKEIFDYERVKHIKQKSMWSVEVMKKLIPNNYKHVQGQPQNEEDTHIKNVESPILIAAKHGITEMVSHILGVCPEAIHDVNAENKNVVMIAVEHRHPVLYEELINNWNFKKTVFGQVDTAGNSLLHIAANLDAGKQFWRIRGAALHMQMEIKWYKFIKKSMPHRFFARYNKNHQTAKEIFKESHRHLIEEGRHWLTSTSQSCSVVAALITTVAFATIPSGLNQENGVPYLEQKQIFKISATSSLIALSSSVISVVMFLGILTSNFKLKDFRKDLPYKLLLGLVSLLISIVSMCIFFYTGHFFLLKHELKPQIIISYTIWGVPLVVFIINKFPLDVGVVWTTLHAKPHK